MARAKMIIEFDYDLVQSANDWIKDVWSKDCIDPRIEACRAKILWFDSKMKIAMTEQLGIGEKMATHGECRERCPKCGLVCIKHPNDENAEHRCAFCGTWR